MRVCCALSYRCGVAQASAGSLDHPSASRTEDQDDQQGIPAGDPVGYECGPRGSGKSTPGRLGFCTYSANRPDPPGSRSCAAGQGREPTGESQGGARRSPAAAACLRSHRGIPISGTAACARRGHQGGSGGSRGAFVPGSAAGWRRARPHAGQAMQQPEGARREEALRRLAQAARKRSLPSDGRGSEDAWHARGRTPISPWGPGRPGGGPSVLRRLLLTITSSLPIVSGCDARCLRSCLRSSCVPARVRRNRKLLLLKPGASGATRASALARKGHYRTMPSDVCSCLLPLLPPSVPLGGLLIGNPMSASRGRRFRRCAPRCSTHQSRPASSSHSRAPSGGSPLTCLRAARRAPAGSRSSLR